jgi:hypothetical protein
VSRALASLLVFTLGTPAARADAPAAHAERLLLRISPIVNTETAAS